MAREGGSLVVLAIVTSRAEALVLASMLEAAGIHVSVDGEHHASVDPISVALGGHRLRVADWQHDNASAVVRELGLPAQAVSYWGGKQAIHRLLAVYLGTHLFWAIPAAVAGLFPWSVVLGVVFAPLGIPVDPRGRPDWYLAAPPSS